MIGCRKGLIWRYYLSACKSARIKCPRNKEQAKALVAQLVFRGEAMSMAEWGRAMGIEIDTPTPDELVRHDELCDRVAGLASQVGVKPDGQP